MKHEQRVVRILVGIGNLSKNIDSSSLLPIVCGIVEPNTPSSFEEFTRKLTDGVTERKMRALESVVKYEGDILVDLLNL